MCNPTNMLFSYPVQAAGHRAPQRLAMILLLGLSAPAQVVSEEGQPALGDLDHITSPLPPDYRIRRNGSVALRICYNWSCAVQAQILLAPQEIEEVRKEMGRCDGESLYERLQRVRIGIWQMEVMAQRYIPALANDLAINDKDQDLEGRTDCVDNATNTTNFLHILSELQGLPGWQVVEVEVRDRLSPKDVHWTAVLRDVATGALWSVDSWFRPHGHLPDVQPLKDWVTGAEAWKPPYEVFNPTPQTADELCSAQAVQKASLARKQG
jgi:hypothetical protein